MRMSYNIENPHGGLLVYRLRADPQSSPKKQLYYICVFLQSAIIIKNKGVEMKKRKIVVLLLMLIFAVAVFLAISVPVFALESEVNEGASVFNPNEWLAVDAYYDENNGVFILTEDYTDYQMGSVWYNHPYDNDFTFEMDYYTGSSDRSLGGADGIVVAFYANFAYSMAIGEDMGFTGCGGFGVELDTYYNMNQQDPNNNHIALIKENVGTHLVTKDLPESEDGKWHHLKVTVEDGVCTAYVDGTEKFSHSVEKTGYGWIGITSATGLGHNLHAVKNITVTGDRSLSVDGRYLDLRLSHEKTSNNCTPDAASGVYEYEITAEIRNSAEATAKDLVVTLDLKDGLRVADSASLTVNLGDLASGEKDSAQWTVYADWPESDIAANYGVIASIGASASLKQENYIYLLSRNEKDNSFIRGVDEWSFLNVEKYYDPEDCENYYLTKSDYSALLERLNKSEKNSVESMRNLKWRGSCYGMSVAAILTKVGVIEPESIQNGADTLYGISKENNDDVESLINFYHLQQKTNIVTMNMMQFALLDTEEQLEAIEAKAIAISTGGSPVLLGFSGNEWAHAVVAYGIERGSYSFGGILGLFADKYDSRILIYDCNNLSDPDESYLYYNCGSDKWYIPRYADAKKLTMACDDITVLDFVNYEITTANYTARLEFEGKDGYILDYNGAQLEINADTDMRSEGIITFYNANILADGTYGESELILTLPDPCGDYTVIPTADHSSFSMYYENSLLAVDCDSANQIGFNADGSIEAQGLSGDYAVTLLFNDGAAVTPWNQTTVSGSNGGNIRLEQTENGVILSGSNMKNVLIQTIGNDGTKDVLLTTEYDSVLLTSNGESSDEPIIMLDTDGDGFYELEYGSDENRATLIILFGGVLTLLAVVIIAFVKTKQKRCR